MIRRLLNRILGRGFTVPLLSVRWGGEEGPVILQVKVVKMILEWFRRKT